MNRRVFLVSLAGGLLAAAPLAAEAQQSPKMPRVAVLGATPSDSKLVQAFSKGLGDAGLVTRKLWLERLEHTWDVESLFALHTGFGRAKGKLDSLDGPTRAGFLERMRGQLAGLPEEAFRYRGTVVCSVACRPA